MVSKLIEQYGDEYLKGFAVVFFAGIVWSFGVIIVRNMEEAQNYQAQYLLYRGFTISFVLLCFLFFKEGKEMIGNFRRIGITAWIGSIGLTMAFSGFIFSITYTTAAATLFMLALQPFLSALLAYIFIKEKIGLRTFVQMLLALLGVLIMVFNIGGDSEIIGILMGFASALGISIFTVTLRVNPNIPQFSTISLAGIVCAVFALSIIFVQNADPIMSLQNTGLSMLHGLCVATGLILYTIGSKYVPAGELALLAMLEVVGGIFWIWIPWFGINEIPSINTMIGGVIICLAVVSNAFTKKQQIK